MAPEAAPDVDLPGEHDPADVTAGRLTRLRLRGEERAMRYAARYSELARRVPLLRVPLQMVSLYVARQRMLLASAVAFRTFLWLLPLALVAAGVLAGIGVASPSAGSEVLAATGVTGTIRGQITAALLESRGSWWVAVLVGLVLSLWTTRTLLRNLVIANAHLWDAAVPRRTQREVLRGTLVFGGAWVAIFAGAALVSHVDRLFPGGIVLSFFGQAVVSGAGWLFVSSYLPDRRTSWTDLLPGAALFGVGLSALHLVSRVLLPARIEHSAASTARSVSPAQSCSGCSSRASSSSAAPSSTEWCCGTATRPSTPWARRAKTNPPRPAPEGAERPMLGPCSSSA